MGGFTSIRLDKLAATHILNNAQFWRNLQYTEFFITTPHSAVSWVIRFQSTPSVYWYNKLIITDVIAFPFTSMYPNKQFHSFIFSTKVQYTLIILMRATQPDHISHSIEQSASWISTLILSSHLCLGLPSGLFPSVFPTNNLYAPRLSPYVPTRSHSPLNS